MKAEMQGTAFLAEQTVSVRLTLENRTQSVLRVPDPLLHDLSPEYILVEPNGTQTTFTHRIAREKMLPVRDPEAPPVREMMELAPNSSWSELIPLDPMFPFHQPGKYRLQIVYTINGDRITSSPMEFVIMAANVTAYAAVPQGRDTGGARLSTAWAHGAGSDFALIDAVRLGNLWGKDAGGKLYSSLVFRGTGSPVRQIGVPAMHSNRGMDFSSWIVWEEGGKLYTLRTESGNAAGTPELLYTGAPNGFRLIQPPVMDNSHNLSVFGIDVHNGTPQLVKITVDRVAKSAAIVQYRVPLPANLIAAQAAHFRENGNNHTSILFLSTDAGDLSLYALPDLPAPRVLLVARLENERPMPGVPLAAYSANDGRTYAAVATAPSAQKRVGVTMVEVAPSGERLGTPAVRSLDFSGTTLVWGYLAAGAEGPHLLWRTEAGELLYASDRTQPVSLIPRFRSDPSPCLLLGEADTFVAGVRETGSFGVEYLSLRNVNAVAPK
jgi:hypothetical protein